MPVLPRVHVLVICDEIRRHDPDPEALDLIGVRTQIQARTFPYVHPQLCIYLAVTGHEGTAFCKVVVVDGNDEEKFYEQVARVRFYGPNLFVHVRVWMQDCPCDAAGVHWVQVFFDDKLVAERRFDLR